MWSFTENTTLDKYTNKKNVQNNNKNIGKNFYKKRGGNKIMTTQVQIKEKINWKNTKKVEKHIKVKQESQ